MRPLFTTTILVALAWLASCRATAPEGTAEVRDTPVAAADGCSASCATTASDEDFFACYSCRCKAAMDGWLPSAADLRCGAAEEILVYKGSKVGTGLALAKITSEETACFNPPRLVDAQAFNGGCNPGSKLGQMQHGSVFVKWICRREHFQADFNNPSIPYDDSGFILHNARTGATCFFDDKDGVTTDTNNPDPDIGGDKGKAAAFAKAYVRVEGDACISCHDNDPFLYTPYLRSVSWPTDGEWMTSPYWRVRATADVAASKAPVGKHLTAEGAAACLGCHRIGQGASCGLLSPDSMGESSVAALQEFLKVHDAKNYGKVRSPQGKEHPWPYWMPSSAFPLTLAAWDAKFGLAKKTLSACCADANAAGCTWEDIPSDPQQVLRLKH